MKIYRLLSLVAAPLMLLCGCDDKGCDEPWRPDVLGTAVHDGQTVHFVYGVHREGERRWGTPDRVTLSGVTNLDQPVAGLIDIMSMDYSLTFDVADGGPAQGYTDADAGEVAITATVGDRTFYSHRSSDPNDGMGTITGTFSLQGVPKTGKTITASFNLRLSDGTTLVGSASFAKPGGRQVPPGYLQPNPKQIGTATHNGRSVAFTGTQTYAYYGNPALYGIGFTNLSPMNEGDPQVSFIVEADPTKLKGDFTITVTADTKVEFSHGGTLYGKLRPNNNGIISRPIDPSTGKEFTLVDITGGTVTWTIIANGARLEFDLRMADGTRATGHGEYTRQLIDAITSGKIALK